MKHRKAVVISGIQRGGTGVAWNILQSHPQLCSPILETGEILFGGHLESKISRRALTNPLRWLYLDSNIFHKPVIGKFLFNIMDNWLYLVKLRNYNHYQNGTKFDNVLYTKDEVKKTYICLKSVNYDVYLNYIFNKYYNESYFIGLIRNGYAVCNGWVRRGQSAKEAGIMYDTLGRINIRNRKENNKYTTIKFEDILSDPFGIAEKLFKFCELDPVSLDKLRLKSTKTVAADGAHTTSYGKEQSKYWFDRNQIFDLLDTSINKKQTSFLKEKDISDFEKEAGYVLDYYNYKLEDIAS